MKIVEINIKQKEFSRAWILTVTFEIANLKKLTDLQNEINYKLGK